MFLTSLKLITHSCLRNSKFDGLMILHRKGNLIGRRNISGKHVSKGKKFSHTVLLPKTSFPMRIETAKRAEMDSFIFNECGFSELYDWQRKNKSGPEFILHDGPPYANGKPHMGHAVNKILKDITIRQKLLQGYKIHYVSGWDCHGLPIELKAVEAADKFSSIQIREKAREFARKTIEEQLNVFQSWGIMTNWSESYFTFSEEYIKNQLLQFLKLYEMGLIYRDMKPVFWSPSSRTALAEAELEYNESHCSTAVTVALPIVHLPASLGQALPETCRVSALIWTTTPWTLPANQAICYNPDISYCFARSGEEVFILASELVQTTQEKLGKELTVLNTFSGDALRDVQYSHPLQPEKQLRFLSAGHVTVAKGTGLVHTAPAHGPDDFCVGLAHGMPVVSLVDSRGCFSAEAGPHLQGLPVLAEGNVQVQRLLGAALLHCEDITHSYPYDWRTKQPVILRASKQWFIDTGAIKAKALESIQEVRIFPANAKGGGNLSLQLQQRPFWCISRQRVWGVPIPVLYDKNEKPVVSRPLIDHYNSLLGKHGPDYWWQLPVSELAPESLVAPLGVASEDLEKGQDVLDIWFDSGLSWSYVLGEERVADLYLEGVDQFAGWFQSSLMTSVALRGKSPYKSVFVHGYAVDEQGLKMSKSVGNVTDPQEITRGGEDLKTQPAFGVDTLRWWVACHGSQGVNVSVSQDIMRQSANEVQKIRGTLRYLLGVLDGFSKSKTPPLNALRMLDVYMLQKLKGFETEVFDLYNDYQYNRVCTKILNFVANEVSSLYCHLTKDRLYCDRKDSEARRCCQLVMKHILETLVRAVAPIVPFLAEEVYMHHPCKDDELFRSTKQGDRVLDLWQFPEAEIIISTALRLKNVISKNAPLTNTLKLHAVVKTSGEELQILEKLAEKGELNELLQVSSVEIVNTCDSEIQVEFVAVKNARCERCRLYSSPKMGELCERCNQVLEVFSES